VRTRKKNGGRKERQRRIIGFRSIVSSPVAPTDLHKLSFGKIIIIIIIFLIYLFSLTVLVNFRIERDFL
jgi:hypothetical protein